MNTRAPGSRRVAPGEGSSRGRRHPRRFAASRDFALPPTDIWRALGDTDHMNRVLRVPAVEFSPPAGTEEGFARRARTRLLGWPLAYREHPFEWVRERGYTVLREPESGPFASMRIGVEITPKGGGRTRVTAFAELLPSGLAGRLLAPFVGSRMASSMLDYCGEFLARRAAGEVEPLPLPRTRPRVDEARLARGVERLAGTAASPGLVEALRQRVLSGSDAQVLRIRPFQIADDWHEDRLEVLRLFLYATRAGLFELRWELMCPSCRVPKGEVGGLAELPDRFHCGTCGIDYATDFDSRVELRFSVHPAVRRAEDAVYCIGSPLRTPHLVAQQRLEPGESRSVTIPLEGPLHLRAAGAMGGLDVAPGIRGAMGSLDVAPGVPDTAREATPEASAGTPRLGVRYAGGALAAETDPALAVARPAGELELTIRNDDATPLLLQVEGEGSDGVAVTAARVTAMQEFRDLFSSEVLAPGQEVGVSTVALLFSDLKGSTALYEGVGDAPAYGRVNRHFDFLRERIAAHNGAVVKTIGDAVMGAFVSLEDALRTGLAIQRDLSGWCRAQGIEPPFVLRVGIHRGPAIVVNANGRLDYFGRTANLAARVERESAGGDVVLMREVLDEPGARLALADDEIVVETFEAPLRGIAGAARLARLRPAPAAPVPAACPARRADLP